MDSKSHFSLSAEHGSFNPSDSQSLNSSLLEDTGKCTSLPPIPYCSSDEANRTSQKQILEDLSTVVDSSLQSKSSIEDKTSDILPVSDLSIEPTSLGGAELGKEKHFPIDPEDSISDAHLDNLNLTLSSEINFKKQKTLSYGTFKNLKEVDPSDASPTHSNTRIEENSSDIVPPALVGATESTTQSIDVKSSFQNFPETAKAPDSYECLDHDLEEQLVAEDDSEQQETGCYGTRTYFTKKFWSYIAPIAQIFLLVISISNFCMGVKYWSKCPSELTLLCVIMMGFFGLLGFSARLVSIAFTRFMTPGCKALGMCMMISAFLGVLCMIIEVTSFPGVKEYGNCGVFFNYAYYMNFFLLGIFIVHLNVLNICILLFRCLVSSCRR
ncbi:hypothetical protein NPIL_587051 [Nephila pilipes]|uniref:Uncharacterized protein n=1 Tax=Nephila pilipes TaxID=299642 RepID=A0A8X6NT94_NEPPI|nr:hypothetical protein NPIL_587051 [Nephila pilipes]